MSAVGFTSLDQELRAGGLKLSGQWADIHGVVPFSPRVLLYGPPGTGKTSAAYYGPGGEILDPTTVQVLECHDELMVSEAVGHFIRVGDRTVFFAGPIALAMLRGQTLLIDEIDLAGGALLSKLRGVLNDPRIAKLPIPADELATATPAELKDLIATGGHLHIIRPTAGFRVVATMNGEREDLDTPLWDRLKTRFRVTELHPAGLARLPQWLREFAQEMALVDDEDQRISLRSWITICEDLLPQGVPQDLAFRAVFEDRAADVRAALQARIGGEIPSMATGTPVIVPAAAPETAPAAPESVAATPTPEIPATVPAVPVATPTPTPTPTPVAIPLPSTIPANLTDARAAGLPVAFRKNSGGAGRPPKPVCQGCGNDKQSRMSVNTWAELVCDSCLTSIYPPGTFTVRVKNPDPNAGKNNRWLPIPAV
jgi:DNA polymerase III delta prime subunit